MKRAILPSVLFAFGCLAASAATCTYSGSWDTTPSAETDEIIITSGDLTWAATLPQTVASWTQSGGTVTFKTGRADDANTIGNVVGDERVFKVSGNVAVNGGTITHAGQPTMTSSSPGWIDGKGVYRLIMDIGGDLTVAAGAAIAADGKGFLSGQKGPGACSRGGCHGGSGGDYSSDGNASLVNKGKMYGSVKSPKTIGSTGSGAMNGGGSVQLKVAGDSTINGTLSANGGSGSWYGAAGGSVYLSTKSLTGASAALIAARGSGTSCCGSGGRISLKLAGSGKTFDNFTGSITAQPIAFSSSQCHSGTIYLETAADAGKGVLLVKGMGNPKDSWGRGTSLEMANDDCDFSKIVLTNGAHLVICSNVTVRASAIEAYGTAGHCIAVAGGTLEVPNNHIFTNHNLRCFADGSVLKPKTEGSGIGLANGVKFVSDRELTVPGDITLLSGSTVTHWGPSDSYTGHRVYIICSNLTVNAGALIDVNGVGFTKNRGDGKPTAEKPSRGGSHGGLAADSGGGKCYGSITNPNTYGSGGAGREGGGIIRLIVRNNLVNNGTITARSQTAAPWGYLGAGGSIYISAGKLTGSASSTISASANAGDQNYAPGGGRVAVALTKPGSTFADYPGTITAAGAYKSNGYAGGAGTVYLRLPGEGEQDGTLVINNNNLNTAYSSTDISTSVVDAEVGNVILTNRAVLKVKQNAALKVRGNFVNAAREQDYLCGELGDADNDPGKVVFTDASQISTLSGTNNFPAFVCATPDKEIRFGVQKTLTKVSGLFSIAGTDGHPVSLNPTVAETYWLLNMLDGSKSAVSYAAATYSDAEGGSAVSAEDTTTADHCKNWIVSKPVKPGDPIRWVGAKSASWADAENWDPQRNVLDTDVVTISGSASYMPQLTENMSFNRLIIESGAFFEMGGYSLTITNGLVMSGMLTAQGSEQLVVAKEASFATVQGSPALTFVGGDVDFTPNGNRFSTVTFGNDGDVTVNGSFVTDLFVCHRDDTAAVRFAAGSVVTTVEADILGVDPGGYSALTLECADVSGHWSLDVSGKASVRGVIVSDALAGGLKIHAELPSVDNGDNSEDWIFNETYAAWSGPVGGDWNEPSNWSDGVVPNSLARVVFNADATVSLTNAVRLRELDVEAGVKIAGADGKITTAEAIEIRSGGTLTNDIQLVSEGVCYVRGGGVMTHSANSGSADSGVKLDLTVGGDMVVESGGLVSATGKGFAPTYGPGYTDGLYGSSHGGSIQDSVRRAYGSVFAPSTMGSGGTELGSDKRGGGRILLNVAGTLTVNGSIAADGFASSGYYVGSGGSVNISCGALAGSGTISADGARSKMGGYGAGGHVAVYQTVATAFADGVTVRATSGWGYTAGEKPSEQGCGTVYLQSAGEAEDSGLCLLSQQGGNSDGRGYSPAAAELPAQNGDDVRRFRKTTFKVTGGGALRLLGDLTINDLLLDSAGTLRLNGHTLTIISHEHRNRAGWKGTVVLQGGQVVWQPKPLCIILR